MTTKSAKDLVAEASREIETLTADEAVKRLGDADTIFVDVREGEEVRKSGKVKGAVHVPRGFLEFQVDPLSPTHKAEFSAGKRLVLYCGSGNRSALAAKTLKEMGIEHVAHVDGGFPTLEKAGADVEHV
ncbi:MAG: rhodanese-like domain-containing protein [Methylobacterium organophilum]|nr:rhodanese-like domain-containing protein [Methylobacterium organophilum]